MQERRIEMAVFGIIGWPEESGHSHKRAIFQ